MVLAKGSKKGRRRKTGRGRLLVLKGRKEGKGAEKGSKEETVRGEGDGRKE